MAHDTKTSVASRNAMVDTHLARLNGGKFRLYGGGSGKPADADTAVTDQVLLAELPLSNPAAAAASGGTGVLNAITASTGLATGTANWGRYVTSAGASVYDVTAGDAADNADVTLNNKNIQSGAAVSAVAGQSSYTLPA